MAGARLVPVRSYRSPWCSLRGPYSPEPGLRSVAFEPCMGPPSPKMSVRTPSSRLKVIVLMVLWRQEQSIDTLILDELLTEEEEDPDPTFH